MADPFLGELRCVAFNYAPDGWAFCNGQILSIATNLQLFALLGATYGGDGQTTFALPDLRGRVPIHFGQGPGLSNYVLGQAGGTETVTLDIDQIPVHNHNVNATTSDFSTHAPDGNFLSSAPVYSTTPANNTLSSNTISNTGEGQPHPNIQPYLTLNWIIALEGSFPPRS